MLPEEVVMRISAMYSGVRRKVSSIITFTTDLAEGSHHRLNNFSWTQTPLRLRATLLIKVSRTTPRPPLLPASRRHPQNTSSTPELAPKRNLANVIGGSRSSDPQVDSNPKGIAIPPLTDAPTAGHNNQSDEPKADMATDISNLFQNVDPGPPSNPGHSASGASSGPSSSSNPLLQTLRSQLDAFTNAFLAEFSSAPRPPVANRSQEKKATTAAEASCESGSGRQDGGSLAGSSGSREEDRSSK
ncbi:hypothetical protein FS837_008145 [Tulasnella sp. UAMH 9824]|nr:hypothetical protein FS837_008145 [Tulasnella sp. UAMH 9824]